MRLLLAAAVGMLALVLAFLAGQAFAIDAADRLETTRELVMFAVVYALRRWWLALLHVAATCGALAILLAVPTP